MWFRCDYSIKGQLEIVLNNLLESSRKFTAFSQITYLSKNRLLWLSREKILKKNFQTTRLLLRTYAGAAQLHAREEDQGILQGDRGRERQRRRELAHTDVRPRRPAAQHAHVRMAE